MGRRGPAKTPTKTLKRRGSWRGVARAKAEPKPKTDLAAPKCPTWLPAAAKTEWKRIVPILIDMRIITTLDRAVLVAYCLAWSELKEATMALKKINHYYITTDKGNLVQHPLVAVKRKAAEALNRFAQQFGLTPAARPNIKAIEAGVDDVKGKGRFFSGN